MKSPWATPDDPRMSEAPAHPPDPIRDTLDAIRESQDFVCAYPLCACEHVCRVTGRDVGRPSYPSTCPACRGTGGGAWNDCPACDGNGVV